MTGLCRWRRLAVGLECGATPAMSGHGVGTAAEAAAGAEIAACRFAGSVYLSSNQLLCFVHRFSSNLVQRVLGRWLNDVPSLSWFLSIYLRWIPRENSILLNKRGRRELPPLGHATVPSMGVNDTSCTCEVAGPARLR